MLGCLASWDRGAPLSIRVRYGFPRLFTVTPIVIVLADAPHFNLSAVGIRRGVSQTPPLKALYQHSRILAGHPGVDPIGIRDRISGGIEGVRPEPVVNILVRGLVIQGSPTVHELPEDRR